MRESVVCIFLHERPGGICIEALNMQKVRHHASGKQPESVQSDIFSFFQGRPSGQQGRPGGLWVSVFLLGGAKKLHSTRPLFFCSGGRGGKRKPTDCLRDGFFETLLSQRTTI